jgi:hypothetical protein
MRKNAYMTARKKTAVERRDRTAPISRAEIAAAHESVGRLATQLMQLNHAMDIDEFAGSVLADGATSIPELLKKLHRLVGKTVAAYNAGNTIPESVPESGSNTRKNVAESRVSPQPSERQKPKKTP